MHINPYIFQFFYKKSWPFFLESTYNRIYKNSSDI